MVEDAPPARLLSDPKQFQEGIRKLQEHMAKLTDAPHTMWPRALWIGLFIELTEPPSDPMYGESLNVRLDSKGDGTYRIRITSPEGYLTHSEIRRVVEVLEGPEDEPDRYIGLDVITENNGLAIVSLC
jgi:hypothetical protein